MMFIEMHLDAREYIEKLQKEIRMWEERYDHLRRQNEWHERETWDRRSNKF